MTLLFDCLLWAFSLFAFPSIRYFHLSKGISTLSHFASVVPLCVFTGFELFSGFGNLESV